MGHCLARAMQSRSALGFGGAGVADALQQGEGHPCCRSKKSSIQVGAVLLCPQGFSDRYFALPETGWADHAAGEFPTLHFQLRAQHMLYTAVRRRGSTWYGVAGR
ncbi:MAG: hypothetical protein IPG64_19630 [Haliea sp.]|nr:hypothetical protein [Haliea sp.]